MKRIAVNLMVTAILLFIACNNPKNHQNMTTQNNQSLYPKGNKLSNEWFSGNALLMPLIAKDKNNEFYAGRVTFEPGARTNWHTHPKGQVLLIIEGKGYYQEKGKPTQVIQKGDVVNIPENKVHLHGATATTQMVHIAITNYKEEEQVSWLQAVTEEEFTTANEINN